MLHKEPPGMCIRDKILEWHSIAPAVIKANFAFSRFQMDKKARFIDAYAITPLIRC